MMDPEIKKRWLEALRSGEYLQAEGLLSDGEGFCCLGVLCDLAAADGVVAWQPAPGFDNGRKSIGDEMHHLPFEVVEWAGLSESNPEVDALQGDGEDLYTWTLSQLNDEGMGFLGIAEIIEAQL